MQKNNLLLLQQQMMAFLQQKPNTLLEQVIGTKKVSAEKRLAIYSNAYHVRLLEALQENYPALHTLLGDDDFQQLAWDYIAAYPSSFFSIRYFGDQLANYIAQSHWKEIHPVLIEMAQFEWAIRGAFDAEDTPLLTLTDLQQIDPSSWPMLQFQFHPGLHYLHLSWNVPQLWKMIHQQEEVDACHQCDPSTLTPERQTYPVVWIVWRKQLRTLYRSLSVDEAWALAHLQKQACFAEVCQGICEWVDECHAAERVAGFIQTWLEEQLLVQAAPSGASG